MKERLILIIRIFVIIFCPSKFKKLVFRKIENLNWKNIHTSIEEVELLLLKYFLNEDTVFFDIGSNRGRYIYQAYKSTNETNIYAFEPIPWLNKRLKRIFRKINIYQLAFSDTTNTNVQFKIPKINNKQDTGRSTLNTQYLEDEETNSLIITVDITSLDTFIENQKINKIDFIKIDVEGHEFEVIKGGANSIEKLRPILQIEIDQRHHTFPITDVINFIKDLGYSCNYFDFQTYSIKELVVDPKKLQIKEDFETKKYIHNFIFIPLNKFKSTYLGDINESIAPLVLASSYFKKKIDLST